MAENDKADVIEACEQLVALLSAKRSEDINNCSMLVFSKFLRARYEQRDKLEMLSETVSNMIGGKLFTEYLQYLRQFNNANAENAIQCYIILMNLVWNTVSDFGEFTLHLLNNGLGAILKRDLQFIRLQLISSAPERYGQLYAICMRVVGSIYQPVEYRQFMEQADLGEELYQLTQLMDNGTGKGVDVQLFTCITVGFLMSPAVIEKITIHPHVVAKLVLFLKEIVSKKPKFTCAYNFKRFGVCCVFHGFEIARAIGAIALNKWAHNELFAQNAFENLVNFLACVDDIHKKEPILEALDALLTKEIIYKAMRYNESNEPQHLDRSIISGTVYFDSNVIYKLENCLNGVNPLERAIFTKIAGIKPMEVEPSNDSYIEIDVVQNNVTAVRTWLNKFAHTAAQQKVIRLLTLAAEQGHTEICELVANTGLLGNFQQQAHLVPAEFINTVRDISFMCALKLACANGHVGVAQMLAPRIRKGDIKTDLYVSLATACLAGHVQMFMWLADTIQLAPNLKYIWGFLLASACGDLETVKHLTMVLGPTNSNIMSKALTCACSKAKIEVFRWLIDNTACVISGKVKYRIASNFDPSLSLNNDTTPLIAACFGANYIIATEMTRYSTPFAINLASSTLGNTALHLAIWSHPADMVFPLHDACKRGDVEAVRALVPDLTSSSDSFDMYDRHGNTPLHIACRYCAVDVIVVLRSMFLNADVTNDEGVTPLQLCESLGHNELLPYMRHYQNATIYEADLQSACNSSLTSGQQLLYNEQLKLNTSKQNMVEFKNGNNKMIADFVRVDFDNFGGKIMAPLLEDSCMARWCHDNGVAYDYWLPITSCQLKETS